MCVCVHVCMRQTCMRVLVVGDQLHLATQQLPVVTIATQALQGGGSMSAGPAPSLQIFVGCKQHTHNTFFSPGHSATRDKRQQRLCCFQKRDGGLTAQMRKCRQVLGTRKGWDKKAVPHSRRPAAEGERCRQTGAPLLFSELREVDSNLKMVACLLHQSG